MLGVRTFLAALLLVLFLDQDSSASTTPRKQPAKSRTVSKQARAACHAAYAVAAKIPGVSIRRRTGTFHDETLRKPVFGCGLSISGSFALAMTTGDAAVRLRDDFSARGWKEMPAYAADGKDGTSFAFRNAAVACLVRGEWNGGADGEPEIPGEDWYKVAVFCVSPAFPENSRE